MTTIASATDDTIQVITRDKGQKGDTGTQGLDGAGFDTVRSSLLDSPLCRLFLPNKIVDTLAGALTSTRASTATYVDRYGVVKTAAIDELREEKEGWLIEGASTNLLTYSEQFDNAGWNKGINVIVTPNTVTSPDGTLSADTFDANSSNFGSIRQPVSASGLVTFSYFVKKGTSNIASIRVGGVDIGGSGVTNSTYEFNLDTETFQKATGSDGVTKFKALANGWYRVYLTVSTTSVAEVWLGTNFSPTAVGTIHVWGAQAEQLSFATSYIPTTTAPATRAADLVEINGLNNFPPTSKSLAVAGFFKQAGYANFNCLFATQSPAFRAFIFEDNMYTKVGANPSAFNQPSNILSDGTYYVSTLSNNALNQYIDGAPSAQNPFSVTGTSDGAPTKIHFGRNEADLQQAYGHIRDFRIYDFALNADEVAFLSGGK